MNRQLEKLYLVTLINFCSDDIYVSTMLYSNLCMSDCFMRSEISKTP